MTPDSVSTPLGMLEFFDGMPTDDTLRKVFDNLDLMRGVESFLNGIPATSIEGIRLELVDAGIDACHKVGIFAVLNSNPLFLIGNTDTGYAVTMLDLGESGRWSSRSLQSAVQEPWIMRSSASWSTLGLPDRSGSGCQVPDPAAGGHE